MCVIYTKALNMFSHYALYSFRYKINIKSIKLILNQNFRQVNRNKIIIENFN